MEGGVRNGGREGGREGWGKREREREKSLNKPIISQPSFYSYEGGEKKENQWWDGCQGCASTMCTWVVMPMHPDCHNSLIESVSRDMLMFIYKTAIMACTEC